MSINSDKEKRQKRRDSSDTPVVHRTPWSEERGTLEGVLGADSVIPSQKAFAAIKI